MRGKVSGRRSRERFVLRTWKGAEVLGPRERERASPVAGHGATRVRII